MADATKAGGGTTFDRALDLLAALLAAPYDASLADVAAQLHLPPSTAHRLAALLVRRRLLVRGERGQYLPGWGLVELSAWSDRRAVLAGVARPAARTLARKSGRTVHVGVLEEGMVTYLVKAQAPGAQLFTQEGMQLEAYCSAIGKILLADLPTPELEEYLREAPFPALTRRTITDAATLRGHLAEVQAQGYAVDDHEVADDLICFAVPIRMPDRALPAALSIASRPPRQPTAKDLRALEDCAAEISRRLFT
jgi:DNA-binding IclR family transcriptional regulator